MKKIANFLILSFWALGEHTGMCLYLLSERAKPPLVIDASFIPIGCNLTELGMRCERHTCEKGEVCWVRGAQICLFLSNGCREMIFLLGRVTHNITFDSITV